MSDTPTPELEQDLTSTPIVGSLENKLTIYKQKLKILKKAYIEENSEKDALKKQIFSLWNTNEKLQKDLEETEQK